MALRVDSLISKVKSVTDMKENFVGSAREETEEAEETVHTGRRGGSMARASHSRSKDRRFEPQPASGAQESFVRVFFRVKNVLLTRCLHFRVYVYRNCNRAINYFLIIKHT